MIELKNIYKSFVTPSGKVSALENVSLRVERGHIYGVIGKSGAGKSTLIRCINLLERPDQGEVIVDQQPLLSLSSNALRAMRHKISMIFQHFNLLNSRTVFENVALPLELTRVSATEIKKTVLPLLEWVGLADRLQAFPSQLSGGQKQRVSIARALATKPKLLLCDEMTSALDPQTTQSILKLVQDINATMGLTILLITHEMEVIKRICDQVAVMDHGQIVEQGEVVQVFRAPKHPMTKNLTQAAFHLTLPAVLQAHVKPYLVKEDGYTLLRISFVGDTAGRPVIYDLIRRFNLQINILQSNVEMMHTQSVGMMLVGSKASAEEMQQALRHLHSLGLTVEVMGYVERDDWHFG